MKPGIYTDLTIEDYHADEGYSSSQLKKMLKSPYLFRHDEKDSAPKDLTKWGNTRRPLAIGGATAALMDGTEVFERGYVVLDESESNLNKNTKAFKEEFAAYTSDESGKTVLLAQEYDQALAIIGAIHNHPDPWTREQIESLFGNPDLRAESSYYHEDSETGLLVKTRPDLVIPKALCADIKTTADCGQWTFSKRILEMGHHIQAAMGIDIINRVDKCTIDNWLLIVVEQTPPHDVAVYYLGKPTLSKGYEKYRQALTQLAGCLKHDTWPGKQSGIEEINIPVYALNEEIDTNPTTSRRTSHG